jgi:hypothetical protein
MAKVGRPLKPIDEKTVEALAKVGATNCEIADHFYVSENVIRNRFGEILTKARAQKKLRLRQLQWQLAEQGNLGMLIWLGKQMLGQTEKVEERRDIRILEEDAKTITSNDLLVNLSKDETDKTKP